MTDRAAQTSAHTPSAGALRAARRVNDHAMNGDRRNYEMNIDLAAELIDRETHAGELLEALEGLMENSEHMSPFGGAGTVSDVRKAGKYMKQFDKAKTAIRKAKGEL